MKEIIRNGMKEMSATTQVVRKSSLASTSMRKKPSKKGKKKEKTESWYSRNSRSLWLVITALIGFVSIHPIFAFIRLVLFLAPVIGFCYAMTGNENRFNVLLFVIYLAVLLIVASAFMTSLFTFNALDPPDIQYPSFSLDAFNYAITMDTIETVFVTLYSVLLIAIPVIAIFGSIWAIIVGRIDVAVKTFLKVFIAILLVVIGILVLEASGYEIFGLTDAVKTAAEFYIGSINAIYKWITDLYCLLTGCGGDGGSETMSIIDFLTGTTGYEDPPVGTVITRDDGTTYVAGDINGDGVIDAWEEFFYDLDLKGGPFLLDAMSTNPYQAQIMILSGAPLLASVLNLFFALVFLNRKARTWTIEFFDKEFPELEEDEELHLMHFNYRVFVFGIILLFGAWMMFLNFANLYRETGIIEFSQIGYISIYTILISVAFLTLSAPRVTLYVRSNWKNTLMGLAIGLATLFIMLQFLTGSSKTLSAYDYEYGDYVLLQVFNNFIFIAPAESLFFHVLIPAVALGWMYNRSQKNLERETILTAEKKIEKMEFTIASLDEMQKLVEDEPKKLAWIKARKLYYRRKQRQLKRTVRLDKDFLYQDFNLAMLFYGVVLGSNFAFSMSHWVLSGIDPLIFWLSGLGIIYMIAGVIMTLVAWRFGWLSCILTHAIYNSATIIMLTILSGGI